MTLVLETSENAVPIVDLYAEHHDALVRFARVVAPEPSNAEDLVQEAFVRLYSSWDRIRDREKVPSYLRSTIANLARGRHRHLTVAGRHRPARPADAASAEEGVLAAERRAEVLELMRHLPVRQRQCVALRYFEGMTETEIAAALGISVGSARTHTYRGMTRLRHLLGATAA